MAQSARKTSQRAGFASAPGRASRRAKSPPGEAAPQPRASLGVRPEENWQSQLAGRPPADPSTHSGGAHPPLAYHALGAPKVIYTPEDLGGFDDRRELGTPGEYPFTRGVYPTMYRGQLWTMRQFSGFGTARDTNRRYKFLLGRGQTGLSVAFDMPTLMGYDADGERSRGEVGREGVAISSLKDMEILFQGIPLEEISTSMTINATAAMIFAFYLLVAQKQGASWEKLRGTLQNDILKEYIAQKEWVYPPRPSLRIITDIISFCAEKVPKWNTISISGYHIREAGSTAVQELAFTLADGFTYIQAGIDAGLDVDRFAPRLSFFFNSHINFFEEVAKFRAARRIWARHMRERFGAKNAESWRLRFHTQTAGVSLTAQQPYNNIVRTALEALAAVSGGTQSLHTNSLDEALALPTEEAVQIALRTQQIIAHETGIADTIDPFGGSYYVESLTNRMEEAAEEYFRRIDEQGGVVAAIENGFFQREISRASYEYQKQVEENRLAIVGVTRFTEGGGPSAKVLKIPAGVEREQVHAIRRLRRRRSPSRVHERLDAIRQASRGRDNLMPLLVRAAAEYCTLGEMVEALKAEFGEYREPPTYW